jgi:polysaccharide export outer membrane protein
MGRHGRAWGILVLAVLLLVPFGAGAQTPEEYTLGPGDVVDVVVLGEPTLTVTVTVRPDGRISYPMLGEMVVAGLKPGELADRIRQGLARYIRQPQVTVSVRDARGRPFVYLVGQVARPGAYEIQRGWTVVQAVASAGGVTPRADLRKSLLLRQNQTLPLDLERVLLRGEAQEAPTLEGGDVVVVPESPLRRVFVLGMVARPGVYEIPEGARLHEAISLAGGPDRRAALEAVGVIRQDTPQRGRLQTFDLLRFLRGADLSQNPLVQPGDVVFVPETRTPDWETVLRGLSFIFTIPFIRW